MTVHVVGAGGMLGQDVMRAAGDRGVGFAHAELAWQDGLDAYLGVRA